MSRVAAGIVDVTCRVGERYAIARAELLHAATLAPNSLDDPSKQLPLEALFDMLEYLLERTQDRSLGLRFAEAMDLRTQGFWGYLFLSSLTVRSAAELLLRFQRVRHTAQVSFSVQGDWAAFEVRIEQELPRTLHAILGDGFLATFCGYRRFWLPDGGGVMRAYLPYPEEPHHRELRALVGGPITFQADVIRYEIPAWELELPMTR